MIIIIIVKLVLFTLRTLPLPARWFFRTINWASTTLEMFQLYARSGAERRLRINSKTTQQKDWYRGSWKNWILFPAPPPTDPVALERPQLPLALFPALWALFPQELSFNSLNDQNAPGWGQGEKRMEIIQIQFLWLHQVLLSLDKEQPGPQLCFCQREVGMVQCFAKLAHRIR